MFISAHSSPDTILWCTMPIRLITEVQSLHVGAVCPSCHKPVSMCHVQTKARKITRFLPLDSPETWVHHRSQGNPLVRASNDTGVGENEEKWRFSTNKLLNIEMIEDSYALYYNGRLIGSRIWPFDLYHFRSPWMTWTTDTQQHQHGHYLTICSFFSGTCTVA